MSGSGGQGQAGMRNTTSNVTGHARYNNAVDEEASTIHKSHSQDASGALKMFPIGFLLFSMAMFIMPTLLVLYVGEDPTSRQFFGHITTRVVICLPALYVVTYIVHTLKQAPSRVFVTLSLIGSCLTLLICSNIILLEAYIMAPVFAASTDCMSWAPKREMQTEWESARTYYAACMHTIAKNQSTTFAAAVNTYRIQECPTYDTELELHPSWAYLEHLEATQWCGGWCTSAPAMWSNEKVQDACAPVVAQILNDKVIWCLKQVCFYAIISLVVISAVLLSMPRVLRDYGIDWYA